MPVRDAETLETARSAVDLMRQVGVGQLTTEKIQRIMILGNALAACSSRAGTDETAIGFPASLNMAAIYRMLRSRPSGCDASSRKIRIQAALDVGSCVSTA